jgi:NADPH2 dehydrogenase
MKTEYDFSETEPNPYAKKLRKQIFTPIKIKTLELKNRVVMPPMCMYRVLSGDGIATKWQQLHYATRAVGGVGLIIVEATGVSPEGRISDRDIGLWNDEQMDALAEIVSIVHENGGKIGIQLNHAGRKSEATQTVPEAPSAMPYNDDARCPVEMSLSDIQQTIKEFQEAAGRANKANFDLLEIHAAHGYLINQFMSPITNRRSDEYGGSQDNRARFLEETIKAVSLAWPEDKALCVRVTAEEYEEGSNVAADVALMLNRVKSAGNGIDLVDVSTGGLTPTAPKVFPGYQLPHAKLIRDEIGLPVIGGGLITSAAEAEEAIDSGQADLIYLGRELLRNPYWTLHAANEMNAPFPWPESYERARPRII